MRIDRRRVHVLASNVHKWLALFVGAQLLIWFASGALMSFLPIAKVRGEHLVDRTVSADIPSGTRFTDMNNLAARTSTPIQAIDIHMVNGRAVAEVKTAEAVLLFDAISGASLPPVSPQQAIAIANEAWKSTTKPAAEASQVDTESPEYRGPLPAWRVAYKDPDSTSVFVAAQTGKITAVRTGTWRLYDFFWGLHIMDWKNHENFNTPWLLAFAMGGLTLGLAGTVLLFMRWPRRKS